MCLASVSPYFKTLFSSPLSTTQQQQQKVVDFNCYSKDSVEVILDLIYGERVNTTAADLAEVLRLTEYLQCDWLLNILVSSIRKTVNETNFHLWYRIAKDNGIEKLTLLLENYIQVNYNDLIKMEEKEIVSSVINEVLTNRKPVSGKEILFYHTVDSVYVIDMLNNQVEMYEDGPCFISKLYPQTLCPEEFKSFIVFCFFMHNNQLFVASTYNLRDTDDGIFNPDCLKDNTKIQVSCYDHCSQQYKNISLIEPCSLNVFEDNEYENANFYVTGLHYDTYDSLYILLEDDEDYEHIIYKFDLNEGCCSDNYIRLAYGFTFVESKQYGTLLVNSLRNVYSIGQFDFKTKGGKHSLKRLEIKSDWHDSSEIMGRTSCKAWRTVSFNGVVYFFAVFKHQKSKLHVFHLNIEELALVHLCHFPISGKLVNAFSHGKLFVVLSLTHNKKCDDCSEVTGENYWCESMECPHQKDLGLYENVYHFDVDAKTFTKVDMEFPYSENAFHVATLPAYLMS